MFQAATRSLLFVCSALFFADVILQMTRIFQLLPLYDPIN